MRKTISAVCFTGTVVLLLMAACKRTVNYTELRSTLADSLRSTNIPGVLIAASHKVQPRNETSATIFHCKRACATKNVYWVQITYPVTVCYPPDSMPDGVLTKGRKPPDSIAGIIQAEDALTETLTRA